MPMPVHLGPMRKVKFQDTCQSAFYISHEQYFYVICARVKFHWIDKSKWLSRGYDSVFEVSILIRANNLTSKCKGFKIRVSQTTLAAAKLRLYVTATQRVTHKVAGEMLGCQNPSLRKILHIYWIVRKDKDVI